jgi:thiol-disulfide isomerase/thioredoxin
MTARLRLALAGAALLALTACGGATTTSAGQPGTDRGQSTAPSSGASADAGPVGSGITASTLDGAAFDFADLSGRPTVLWFWAPWCTICRAEAPEIAAAAERLGDDVAVLGVPGRGEVPDMEEFVSDTGVGDLEHVVDTDGEIWSAFGVISQPAFAFIDASGDARVVNGAMGGDDFEQAARGLLG